MLFRLLKAGDRIIESLSNPSVILKTKGRIGRPVNRYNKKEGQENIVLNCKWGYNNSI